MDAEVLIVGAGPTGLMLANELARRGVEPLIIDRHSGPAQQSRALAVHARTLEIYRMLGVDEAALAQGLEMTGANLWANGVHSARIPLGEIGTGLSAFPFVLILGQDANERILGSKLADQGIHVQWRTELIGLEQSSEGVIARLRLPDGSERAITTAWLAGCDGSRSPVREMNGIGFPGAPYEHVFFVADTRATGPMKPAELNVYLWQGGFHLFFPMRGENAWRVVGILPDGIEPHDGLRFEDVAPAIRREAGADLSFQECHWFSTYRIAHRAAERFRQGRCFLLGDAAHIHSPAGGQGMNTGLQDAYNLGWKLAMVCRGQADAALLDSYEAERLPVARRLLETTDRAFQFLVADNWIAGAFRTQVMARLIAAGMGLDVVRRRAFATVSQIGISYPDSPLSAPSGLPASAPRPGERFPWLALDFMDGGERDLYRRLGDATYNLVVFGAPAPPSSLDFGDAGEVVRIHPVPETDGNRHALAHGKVPVPSWYLLRPDGHIGACGRNPGAAEISDYLEKRGRVGRVL